MKQQQGFTLIELVLVIILVAVMANVASTMLAEGLRAYLTTKNITDADWQGRIALQRMERDIRAIRSSNDVATATSSQLSFVDTSGTTITYELSGTTLLRNSQALADGIQTLTFSYFDQNGTSTATTTAIRYIRIALNITQGNANYTVTTAIYPRNLL